MNFDQFHLENPHVYKQLLELAYQAHNRGRKRIGMQMLFEVLRWNRMLATTDSEFKLNNNYAAYYSRMIMEKNPELEGLFETRIQLSKLSTP